MFLSQQKLMLLALGLSSTIATAATTLADDMNSSDAITSVTRIDNKRTETGNTIAVLDEQYIKDNQARTISELLQDIPGVSVIVSSHVGTSSSVFIRGASANSALIVVDGITVTSDYIASMVTDNVERIEVLKGAQSATWGDGATAGVISITTKKGKANFAPSASFEMNEYNYTKTQLALNGAQGKSDYSFSASQIKNDTTSDEYYQNNYDIIFR